MHPFPAEYALSVESTSLGHHIRSGVSSPKREHYSPASVSLASTTVPRRAPHETFHQFGPGRPLESRGCLEYVSTSYNSLAPYTPVMHPAAIHWYGNPLSDPPPFNCALPYHGGKDIPSRRAARDSASLPPLTHENTSPPSESTSPTSIPYQAPLLPDLDVPKTFRVLPQPVATLGATLSPLDQRQVSELRHGLSWLALLKAGGLARDTDTQR